MMIDKAQLALEYLKYDRDRWDVTVVHSDMPTRNPVSLFVSTRQAHQPTGLHTSGNAEIPNSAFDEAESLLSVMQHVLDGIFADIEELGPPTMEDVARLSG